MIQSINLSNSYMVPFGLGSALIKCKLITLTQAGAGVGDLEGENIVKGSVAVCKYIWKNYFGIFNMK